MVAALPLALLPAAFTASSSSASRVTYAAATVVVGGLFTAVKTTAAAERSLVTPFRATMGATNGGACEVQITASAAGWWWKAWRCRVATAVTSAPCPFGVANRAAWSGGGCGAPLGATD